MAKFTTPRGQITVDVLYREDLEEYYDRDPVFNLPDYIYSTDGSINMAGLAEIYEALDADFFDDYNLDTDFWYRTEVENEGEDDEYELYTHVQYNPITESVSIRPGQWTL